MNKAQSKRIASRNKAKANKLAAAAAYKIELAKAQALLTQLTEALLADEADSSQRWVDVGELARMNEALEHAIAPWIDQE